MAQGWLCGRATFDLKRQAMKPTRPTLFLLAALALPAAAHAQRVAADVVIGAGPVTGRVIVGEPYHYRPAYHPRVAYREVVVVRHYRGYGWYRNHGYRSIRVYYDPHRRVYYDPPYRPRLRTVVVYQRGGRYYSDERNDYRGRVAERRDDRYHDRDHDYDRR